MGRITVFSGVERRRRWDDDEKLAMVEASLAPGASVARIARERDVAPSLIRSDADPLAMVIEIGDATVRVANSISPALLMTALRALSR